MQTRHLIATRIFDVPLLVEKGTAEAIVSYLAEDLGVEAPAPLMQDSLNRPERRPAIYEDQGGIAVVPVVGELMHRAAPAAAMSGIVGYTGLQNQLLALADDPRVRAILLDLDTPGGEVGGIVELSDAISEISGKMPVWAIANSTMASAGYWIGAAADRVLATPYSRVGSIGVVMMHVDVSKAVAKKGIVTTFVHAGKHKIDGNMFEPLSEEARASMVSGVNEVYGQFVDHVAKARNMTDQSVRDTEAKVYGAKEALEIGLVDGISTLSKTIGGMRSAVEDRRRAMFQGMSMKTYEDGITEGKALGIQEGISKGSSDAAKVVAEASTLARAEASKAERDRISAIVNSPEAKGREHMANHLAFATTMGASEAEELLKVAPKTAAVSKPEPKKGANLTADSILDHLRANSPPIGIEDAPDAEETDQERRKAQIRAIAAMVTARRPKMLTQQ